MCRTGVLSFMSESNECSQRDEGARDPYETEKSSFGMKIQLYENTVEIIIIIIIIIIIMAFI